MIKGTVSFSQPEKIFSHNERAIINGRTSLEWWVDGPWVCVRDTKKPELGRVKIHGSRCSILEPDWRPVLELDPKTAIDKEAIEASKSQSGAIEAPKKPARSKAEAA